MALVPCRLHAHIDTLYAFFRQIMSVWMHTMSLHVQAPADSCLPVLCDCWDIGHADRGGHLRPCLHAPPVGRSGIWRVYTLLWYIPAPEQHWVDKAQTSCQQRAAAALPSSLTEHCHSHGPVLAACAIWAQDCSALALIAFLCRQKKAMRVMNHTGMHVQRLLLPVGIALHTHEWPYENAGSAY